MRVISFGMDAMIINIFFKDSTAKRVRHQQKTRRERIVKRKTEKERLKSHETSSRKRKQTKELTRVVDEKKSQCSSSWSSTRGEQSLSFFFSQSLWEISKKTELETEKSKAITQLFLEKQRIEGDSRAWSCIKNRIWKETDKHVRDSLFLSVQFSCHESSDPETITWFARTNVSESVAVEGGKLLAPTSRDGWSSLPTTTSRKEKREEKKKKTPETRSHRSMMMLPFFFLFLLNMTPVFLHFWFSRGKPWSDYGSFCCRIFGQDLLAKLVLTTKIASDWRETRVTRHKTD